MKKPRMPPTNHLLRDNEFLLQNILKNGRQSPDGPFNNTFYDALAADCYKYCAGIAGVLVTSWLTREAVLTESEMNTVEMTIATLVHAFYGKGCLDPMLGPFFHEHRYHWEMHLRSVTVFWSQIYFQTSDTYRHLNLRHLPPQVEPRHINRWLELFAETAKETLPSEYARTAISKAWRMSESFRDAAFVPADKPRVSLRHLM